MARTDTLNAANVANEITVFRAANQGRAPYLIAVKDGTLQAAAVAVVLGGTLGHFDTVIDASLGAGAWEGRARVTARTAEQMLNDAKAGDARRHPHNAVGQTPWPYGGQLQ